MLLVSYVDNNQLETHMQNTHDWTTDICVADNRVFVKGGLSEVCQLSYSCWLLNIAEVEKVMRTCDVLSSFHHFIINRAPLHQVTISGQQHQTLRTCGGKKGEFGYKYKTICFLVNNNRTCAMSIVSCCMTTWIQCPHLEFSSISTVFLVI